MQRFLNSPWTSIFLPALVGLGGVGIAVRGFETYGWTLFLGMPVLVSLLASFA